MVKKDIAIFGIVFAVLAMFANPVMANHIDTATVSATCNSYTIDVTASELDPGKSYTIDYTIILTPTTGSPTTITDSIPFTAPSNGIFSGTVTKPLGPLTGGFTLSGTATLGGFNEIPISFSPDSLSCPTPPPQACIAETTIASNFNGTPINGGSYIWFNANFKASGIPSAGATVFFNNSTIQFTADQTYNLPVPNAQITFSPNVTCASTSFDSLTNTWQTTVPISGSDEIFLSGLAFPVPASFANVGGKVQGSVIWNGTLGTNTPGVSISISWKWGAAVYTTFSTDYNALAVKPTHSQSCLYNNSDHAGTPEGVDTQSGKPFKEFVTGGARGGGGSNFTGSWSGTTSVKLVCP
jgi:hypothetical protein